MKIIVYISKSFSQVKKYSTTVLSAMMAGMDDKEDPDDDITTEAMSGLSRILCEIEESHIRAILINVSLKIRPCFEKVILPICCSVYFEQLRFKKI